MAQQTDNSSQNSLEVLSIDTRTKGELKVRFASPAGSKEELTKEKISVSIAGNEVKDFSLNPVEVESLSVTLVMDVSGSMEGEPLNVAKQSAIKFVNSLPKQAEVSLVSFGDTAQLRQAATADRAAVLNAINTLESKGETALYDGLMTALANQPKESEGRQVIVLLSDGGDTASKTSLPQAANSLTESSSRLISISLETEESNSDTLKQLAGSSGEVVATSDVGALDKIYSDLATNLAKEYELIAPTEQVGISSLKLEVADGAEGGFVWTKAINFSADNQIVAAKPQPEALVEQIPQVSITNGSHLLWAGVFLVLFGVVAFIVALNFRKPEKKPKSIKRQAVKKQNKSQIDAFNDLRMGATAAVEAAFNKTEGKAGLAQKLEKAGLGLRSGEFILISIGVAFLGLFIGLTTKGLIGAVAGLAIGIFMPRFHLKRKIKKRRKQFGDRIPDLLSQLANALKAGYSLPQAVTAAAAEIKEPMKSELNRVLVEARVGGDLVKSLRGLADRSDSKDMGWIVDAIEINATVGGDLVNVLQTVSDTIRARVQLAAQVDALTAEGRMSAWLLISLPPGLCVVILILNPKYFDGIWGGFLAYAVAGAALFLLAGGTIWLKKMVSGVSLK